jgi:hypothetical protein
MRVRLFIPRRTGAAGGWTPSLHHSSFDADQGRDESRPNLEQSARL